MNVRSFVKNMINKNNWNKFITLFVTVLSFIFVYHGFSTKSFASSIAFLSKITAPDKSAGDSFGLQISIFNKIVCIGAPNKEVDEKTNAGQVYIFRLNENNSHTLLAKVNNDSVKRDDNFGSFVEMSQDFVMISGDNNYYDDYHKGAVFVYKTSNGSISKLTKLEESVSTGGIYGNSISINDESMIVTAVNDYSNKDQAGAAFYYKFDDSENITLTKTFGAPSPVEDGYFGNSSSISGKFVVVGNENSNEDGLEFCGSVFLYAKSENDLIFLNKITSPNKIGRGRFGSSVSVSDSFLAIGEPYSNSSSTGAVYLYDLENNSSAFNTKLVPTNINSRQFGMSVSIEKNVLVIGAPYENLSEGAVYVYKLEKESPPKLISRIISPDKATGDYFGYNISHSGNYLAVGSHGTDLNGVGNAGAVYIYDLTALMNEAPTDLNSTALLAFPENQPVGTIIGEFNATDQDANSTLSYFLVSGVGDHNNSLFTLETNGTLRTATTFDYESNATTYSIRVGVNDEFNASVEGNFTVFLQDIPIETNLPPSNLSIIGSLSMVENLPLGSIIGEFNASDPNEDILSYSFADGNGDNDNDLFTIWSIDSVNQPNHENLILWLDANDSATITDFDGNISIWQDKSGNQNHATQAIESFKPQLGTNQVNFDGNKILQVENDPFNGIQNPTIIVLAKWTASSTWGNTLVSYHGESGVGWQIRQIDGNFGKAGFTIRGTEGDDDSPPANTDQTSFFIGSYYRKNSDTRIMRHNGTQTLSIADEGVIAYSGSGRSAIGGRFQADSNSSPGGMVKGAIREIIVFDGANDNEVIEMESYLARKWGTGSSTCRQSSISQNTA